MRAFRPDNRGLDAVKSSSIWAYCDGCRDEVTVRGTESALPLRAATQALTCNSGHLCLPDLSSEGGSVAVFPRAGF